MTSLEYVRTLNFHGALYEVACECRDGARGECEELADAPAWDGASGAGGAGEAELVVDVECESGERWTGSFTADYVESLTSKTGNYKSLATFARMLSGALDGAAAGWRINSGAAATATWTFRGRVAAPPRPRRGNSAETTPRPRHGSIRGEQSRRRRGRDMDLSEETRRGAAAAATRIYQRRRRAGTPITS